ncbi:MAG: glycosyltransferase family 39 protein [Polyangiaceae bacterium]|jgi:4-amino-4-deoxy-L-arabinose transferase-like glycosyltransferase
MSEPQISEPARDGGLHAAFGSTPESLASTRRTLTVCGTILVLANVALRASDLDVGPALPAVVWVGAALLFFCSFVVHMMEPQGTTSAGKELPPAPTDAVDARPAPQPSRLETGNGTGSTGAEKPSAPPIFRPGNPLRLVRGGATAGIASLLTLVLMGHDGQLRWGVPIGTLLVAIASWGVMDLLGTFDDPDERVTASTTWRALARPLAACTVSWLLFCLSLGFAQAGVALPPVVWGLVITAAFLASVATTFDVGVRLGTWDVDAQGPLWKRYGFWVVAIAAGLYFPFMGTSSLWDPWETHYGEVAREMLARDDWISLWWAQDGWFWSKPVLDMWMQAIAMATLGVHYEPDKMLVGNGTMPTMHPEWAVRAPIVLLTILAMYLLYKGAAKSFGPRAAFLGSLVLATMPDWYLLAHQTMTDMPFVAAMTACLGLVMIGLRTPEGLEARAYEVTGAGRRFRFTGWHLVFGAVLICALPQIIYLLSRNIEFLWRPGARGFRPHWDEFRSGSGGGNCGLPGNEECRATLPAFIPHSTGAAPTSLGAAVWRTVGAFEPGVQALVWLLALAAALYMGWGERRVRRLYYLAAWFFAAISTLGKGPAGFGLPILVTLAYLAASRPDEQLLTRLTRIVREITQFEVVAGLFLIVPVVALPWYVAEYVRHGSPFTDRLIYHDMFNRAFSHVHDTNEGDDTSFRFYVWQLGYALFPWTGLAPLGLLWWLARGQHEPSERTRERTDASVLLFMWFLFGFALFSFMGTKFHHYIFPAVPPIAMLIGVVLDDMLGAGPLAARNKLPAYLGGLAAGAALLVYGVALTQPGSFFGFKSPQSPLAPPSTAIGVVLLVVGAAVIAGVVYAFRSEDGEPETGRPAAENKAHTARMLAGGAVAGALLMIVVTRDLVTKGETADQPGAIRLLQLYTYNYRRPWPEALDFSAALTAFGVIAAVALVAIAVRSVRRHAVAAMCTFGFVWALWGLDVYMQRTAQHWGQHEVIAAYYADRSSPREILVAYQMNWKGENFYTGNHIPAFVSTGATFTSWLTKQRESGAKVMYFITEHGRVGGLKGEVKAKAYREVTDRSLCNKFTLVRAEL